MISARVEENGRIRVLESTVSDSVLFEKIRFDFPESWNGYTKTAVFRNGETTVGVVLDESSELCTGENECYIPYEVIKAPQFTVSVFGVSGESRATTQQASINVTKSGYGTGDTPAEPTPTQYEQIIGIANEMKQLANEAMQIAKSVRIEADNGKYNGKKGDTGDQGKKGEKGDPFIYSDFTQAQLSLLKGAKGEKGDKGDKGDTGPRGPQGLQGIKGDKGDVGDTGPRGLQGEKGDTGAQGIQGVKGDKGEKGDKGDAFTYDDFTSEQLLSLKGEKGDKGEPGNIENIDRIYSPISENAQSGKALSSVFAPIIKESAYGNNILIKDISTINNNLSISLIRKNLFDLNTIGNMTNWQNNASVINISGYSNYPIGGLLPNTYYTLWMAENKWSGEDNNELYVSLGNTPGVWLEAYSLCHNSGEAGYCNDRVTIKTDEAGVLYFSFYNPTQERLSLFFEKCLNIMLNEGSEPSDYCSYVNDFTEIVLTVSDGSNNLVFTPDNVGNVNTAVNFNSEFNIYSNSNSVFIACEYFADTKKYIDNKFSEIASV